MKRILVLLAAIFTFTIRANAQNIEFAEVSFYQDSIDPMTIHLVGKVKCSMYINFSRDAETVIWGDGTQSYIGLTDTSFEYPGFIDADPLKTYRATHTYLPMYADSIVNIGLYLQDGVYESVHNALTDPRQMSLCPIATINFAYLHNHTRIAAPHFSSYTFLSDTVFQTLHFNPDIVSDSSFMLKVQMIAPIVLYPTINAGGILPINLYPMRPDNIAIVDSTNGDLTWTSPLATGAYMISYRLSMYKDSVFVCSMTRDFMVNVFDSASVNTGIKDIDPATISIYPNPAFDRISIRGLPHDAPINISDMTGRICISQTARDQINISALPSGIYYLSIQDQDGVITKKFVKQ